MSKYVIKKVPSGVKFDLRAGNGQTVLTSEVYTSEAVCRKGIESVRKNAPQAGLVDRTEEGFPTLTNPKFELYLDRSGSFRFRLRAKNGRIIAVSQAYTVRAACLNGIDFAKHNAAEAEIQEE